MASLSHSLTPYRYAWPDRDLASAPRWQPSGSHHHARVMPETREDLARDSRWPALFPSSMCLVTASDGTISVLEKVVGASIVNRFPYVMALSFCRTALSTRHYARRDFTDVLERSGMIAVQFLPPGDALDRALALVTGTGGEDSACRLARTGLRTRSAVTGSAAVFADAYLVYEGRLARPGRDFEGEAIYRSPWLDVGSHRVYFVEVSAIQLREDIAAGRSQIRWRSLPAWTPAFEVPRSGGPARQVGDRARYQKGYTPHYAFPSPETTAFEPTAVEHGMAIKVLPSEAADQVEVDNDLARWPCFFPSSLGMVTAWADDGTANVMPCGSTTVVSRHPLVVSPCVAYAAINERYAPRMTLALVRKSGAFGCGVPFISDRVVDAIKYAGNVSMATAANKAERAGLAIAGGGRAPVLCDLPVHFDCEVEDEVRLGTHVMFLGHVRRVLVRSDVTPSNPLEWCAWSDVRPSGTG